jgi:hypothetical protein
MGTEEDHRGSNLDVDSFSLGFGDLSLVASPGLEKRVAEGMNIRQTNPNNYFLDYQ